MPYAFTIDRGEGPEALSYGPFVDANGNQCPANVLDLEDDDDLAARGVARELIEEPPVRRLVPKSVIHERVNAIGKLGDAFAALNAQPILFGRWFAPDWPNVYFDDADLLALLDGVGCTAEEIEAITAPVGG